MSEEYITKEQFDLLASQWEEALHQFQIDIAHLQDQYVKIAQKLNELILKHNACPCSQESDIT